MNVCYVTTNTHVSASHKSFTHTSMGCIQSKDSSVRADAETEMPGLYAINGQPVEFVVADVVQKLWLIAQSGSSEVWAVHILHADFPAPIYACKITRKRAVTCLEDVPAVRGWEMRVQREAEAARIFHGVSGILPVLLNTQDEEFLYTLMEFCPGVCLWTQSTMSWDNAHVKEAVTEEAEGMATAGRDYIRSIAKKSPALSLGEVPLTAIFGKCRVWSLEELLWIARSMCISVAEVHKKGWLHRDIKPENFMITSQGKVVLGDFGIACQGTTSTLTSGTAPYMAPEIFMRGHLHGVGADWYAVGMTLCKLITQKLPWHMGRNGPDIIGCVIAIHREQTVYGDIALPTQKLRQIIHAHLGVSMFEFLRRYVTEVRREDFSRRWMDLALTIESCTSIYAAYRPRDWEVALRSPVFYSVEEIPQPYPIEPHPTFYLAAKVKDQAPDMPATLMHSFDSSTEDRSPASKIENWDYDARVHHHNKQRLAQAQAEQAGSGSHEL